MVTVWSADINGVKIIGGDSCKFCHCDAPLLSHARYKSIARVFYVHDFVVIDQECTHSNLCLDVTIALAVLVLSFPFALFLRNPTFEYIALFRWNWTYASLASTSRLSFKTEVLKCTDFHTFHSSLISVLVYVFTAIFHFFSLSTLTQQLKPPPLTSFSSGTVGDR